MKQKQISPTERYSPSIKEGLTFEQVNTRLIEGNVNKVAQSYSKSYLNIFIGNVCTFFNLLGLIVAIALISVKAELSQFFFVLIYLANISIGIIQEIRAKICIEKLTLVVDKNTKVIRDGNTVEISSKDLVLDDVIVLGSGNQIPTDCVILDGNVEVNEALLTGESIPVKKKVGEVLLAGSFITSGNCYAQAAKVGKDNYIEQLSAKAKKYKKPYSELMSSLRKIIKTIGFVIVPIAITYLIKPYIFENGNPVFSDVVKGTSAVIIGMIPSGMFLLTSVALAVGIIKLARHKTLVQDLYSLETLARVDTICFDKTGTITDGKMSVKELITIKKKDDEPITDVISSMLFSLKDNNQTAIALCDYFGQTNKYKAQYTLPFNSDRKLSAVTFEKLGTYAFGAPEFVLTTELYEQIRSQIEDYASKGLRVLLVGKSNTPLKYDFIPHDFEAVGIILLEDNIRTDAIATIKWFKENGVQIKVISGDNPITVAEVSKRVGIENADKFISLDGLTDQEVYDIADKYTVFGRVSPEQKAIIIRSLNEKGHTTSMTGDGVNDILALKEANCAISVASGSEAARNVSHLVLLDNNFNSLPKVVYEGRRVINNIQSSASLYLMKTCFTFLLSIIILFIPFIQTYPFVTSHMIVLEVFVIGLPSFMLSLQPNSDKVEGKFLNHVINKTLPCAFIMIFNELIILLCQGLLSAKLGFAPNVYTTMGAYALTFAGAISLLSISRPLNKFRGTMYFSCLTCIIAFFVLGLLGLLSNMSYVKMVPLSNYWHHYLILLCLILIDFPLLSFIKKLLSKIQFNKKQ